jgi:hypothetical protein
MGYKNSQQQQISAKTASIPNLEFVAAWLCGILAIETQTLKGK